MPLEQLETVLQHLRKLTHARTPDERPDAELLGRFVARRDGDAFAELVRRHGPMVLGVCRRLLPVTQDAEDAFQATFLVLVRRAASLRDPGRLGCWLYGVALRVAREARARSARRPHVPLPDDLAQPERPDAVVWREVRALLDEELGRLSERDRGPVVLCDLEGQTHQDAARALGIPPGSLSRRLARSRDLLRRRLARRGVTLSAGTLVALLAGHAAPAVPPALLSAAHPVPPAAGAGGVTARAVALADGVLRATSATRLNLVALFLLVLGAAGAAALLPGPPESPPSPRKTAPPAPRQKPAAARREPVTDLHGDPLPPNAVARMGTTRLRHGTSAQAVAFSRDGKFLASADWNRHLVRVWDAATGKELKRLGGHKDAVYTVAFSPDGRTLASGGADDRLRLWDARTGEQRQALPSAGSWVESVAFAPDGRAVAAGTYDGMVRVWELASGKPRLTLPGHQGRIRSLCFSPDGYRLASGSWDTTALVWDVGGRGAGKPAARGQLTPGQADALWADLASDDAAVAFRAVVRLAAARDQAVALLGPRLKRLPVVDARGVEELIASLGDRQFKVREKATRELEELGESAEPILRKALAKETDREKAHRIERILEKLEQRGPSAGRLRVLRAIEALERVGTAPAKEALRPLAERTPVSPETQEARAALKRLERSAE